MGHQEHRCGAPLSINLAIITVSTTRTLKTDESGGWIAERASKEGHKIVAHKVVTDQIDAIQKCLLGVLATENPHAVIATGGTGITPHDVTPEAIHPLLTKELTAFGTLFTQLSYGEIGSAALLSRAAAGVIGNTLIFCIPGSLNASKLACKKLIFPELGHLVRHSSGT